MSMRFFAVVACGFFFSLQLTAADADAGSLHLNINSNGVKTVSWPRPLVPALEVNQLRAGVNLTNLVPISPTSIATTTNGYSFSIGSSAPALFFSLAQGQMTSDALLTASLLNRLTYGPTPDELERVTTIGPQAFIDEQLNMEALVEPMDETPPASVQTTNSVPPENQVKTKWINVRIPGRFSNTNLYMYLTSPGEAYVDDVSLYAGTGTNINFDVNYVQNGDFESPLSGPCHADKATWDNVVVVTLSEFGRTTVENADQGTDHAEASVMWVAGGGVQGYDAGAGRSGVFNCGSAGDPVVWNTGGSGAMYGVSGRYLSRACDYRQVLGEIVRDHLGATQAQLNRIIPGNANSAEHLLTGGLSTDGVQIRGELGLV